MFTKDLILKPNRKAINFYCYLVFGKDSDFLMLSAILCLLLVTTANGLMTTFLALELLGLSIYILVGIKRNSIYSVDGGFKYIFVAFLSTAYYLLGCDLLFVISSLLVLSKLHCIISEVDLGDDFSTLVVKLSNSCMNSIEFCLCEGAAENVYVLYEFKRPILGNLDSLSLKEEYALRRRNVTFLLNDLFQVLNALLNASDNVQKRLILAELDKLVDWFSDLYFDKHQTFNSFKDKFHILVKEFLEGSRAEQESLIPKMKKLIEDFCQYEINRLNVEESWYVHLEAYQGARCRGGFYRRRR